MDFLLIERKLQPNLPKFVLTVIDGAPFWDLIERKQMKKIRSLVFYRMSFLLFILPVLALTAHAQSSTNGWVGGYELFDAQKGGPKNQPGNYVAYRLTVSRNGDSLFARFTADGTQTSDDYECRIETGVDSMKVFFARDAGGSESGKAKPLKSGDLMFTLVKIADGKKTRYLFRPGAYEILPLSAVPKNKIYFERKK